MNKGFLEIQNKLSTPYRATVLILDGMKLVCLCYVADIITHPLRCNITRTHTNKTALFKLRPINEAEWNTKEYGPENLCIEFERKILLVAVMRPFKSVFLVALAIKFTWKQENITLHFVIAWNEVIANRQEYDFYEIWSVLLSSTLRHSTKEIERKKKNKPNGTNRLSAQNIFRVKSQCLYLIV